MTLNADLAIPDQTPFAHHITSTQDDVVNVMGVCTCVATPEREKASFILNSGLFT